MSKKRQWTFNKTAADKKSKEKKGQSTKLHLNDSSENSDYSDSNSDRAKQQRIIPNESFNEENESEHSLVSNSESDECDYNKKKYKLKSKRIISDSDSEDDICKKKQKNKIIISDSEEEIKTSKDSPCNNCLKQS